MKLDVSDFTYEKDNVRCTLETYEWDNVWWEHAADDTNPRVLYIGDSISCATRRVATAESGNTLYFDGFGTSKALDNPYFYESVTCFARQQRRRDVIVFNNGLHGWHLKDEDEYAEHYEKMIRFLQSEFAGTPILLVLTTHVKDPERDKRVRMRNHAVCVLSEKYGLGTVDFYKITNNDPHLLSSDGVHLSKEGYELLARELVKEVRAVIW